MKYLILLIVVVGVAWWMWGRRGKPAPKAPANMSKQAPAEAASATDRKGGATPQAMLACAHCGVHLPESETMPDAQGRRYCSEAHRLAGAAPR